MQFLQAFSAIEGWVKKDKFGEFVLDALQGKRLPNRQTKSLPLIYQLDNPNVLPISSNDHNMHLLIKLLQLILVSTTPFSAYCFHQLCKFVSEVISDPSVC